jgi:hypothetical protein
MPNIPNSKLIGGKNGRGLSRPVLNLQIGCLQ